MKIALCGWCKLAVFLTYSERIQEANWCSESNWICPLKEFPVHTKVKVGKTKTISIENVDQIQILFSERDILVRWWKLDNQGLYQT